MIDAFADLTVSDWAAIAAAGAAAMAVLVSIRANRISVEALRLAKLEHEARQPQIQLYLLDSFSYAPADESFRVYAFAVSLRNAAAAPNTIPRIELLLTCEQESGELLTRSFLHTGALHTTVPSNLTPLDVPTRLDPKGSDEGWVLFDVDRQLIRELRVHRMVLSFSDVHDRRYELEPIIVTEAADERALAQERNSD